jgi:hypothetical protein
MNILEKVREVSKLKEPRRVNFPFDINSKTDQELHNFVISDDFILTWSFMSYLNQNGDNIFTKQYFEKIGLDYGTKYCSLNINLVYYDKYRHILPLNSYNKKPYKIQAIQRLMQQSNLRQKDEPEYEYSWIFVDEIVGADSKDIFLKFQSENDVSFITKLPNCLKNYDHIRFNISLILSETSPGTPNHSTQCFVNMTTKEIFVFESSDIGRFNGERYKTKVEKAMLFILEDYTSQTFKVLGESDNCTLQGRTPLCLIWTFFIFYICYRNDLPYDQIFSLFLNMTQEQRNRYIVCFVIYCLERWTPEISLYKIILSKTIGRRRDSIDELSQMKFSTPKIKEKLFFIKRTRRGNRMLVYTKDKKYESELTSHGAKRVEEVDETVVGYPFVFLVNKDKEVEMEAFLKTLE